jgi:hypothetical protein
MESFKIPKSHFHVLKNIKYEEYINECNKCGFSKINRYNKPLHLYSFYVYLAYIGAWKFIDRKQLKEDQVKIMKQLGCFQDSRTDLGKRWFMPFYNVDLPLVN